MLVTTLILITSTSADLDRDHGPRYVLCTQLAARKVEKLVWIPLVMEVRRIGLGRMLDQSATLVVQSSQPHWQSCQHSVTTQLARLCSCPLLCFTDCFESFFLKRVFVRSSAIRRKTRQKRRGKDVPGVSSFIHLRLSCSLCLLSEHLSLWSFELGSQTIP